MARHAKGVLFVDYVRMLRAHKGEPWAGFLEPEDLPYLDQHIDEEGWYPMGTFERMGIAILELLVSGDLDLVRSWGRVSAAQVAGTLEGLIVPGDPRESFMRFHVVRRSLFDFETLTVLEIDDNQAALQVDYGMSPRAEEAAALQTLGFFEGLVELADGRLTESGLSERAWAGDARTVMRLAWELPG